jgi:hypothetical protein
MDYEKRRGKGRKRKLPAELEEEFRQQLENLQKSQEGGRIRGQDVQVLLKEKFHVDHALPVFILFFDYAWSF